MASDSVFVQSEMAILDRLVRAEKAGFSVAAARSLLKIDFEPADRERMHQLAMKAQEGTLTAAEPPEEFLMMGRKKLGQVKAEVAALLGRLPGGSPRAWLDREIESAKADPSRDVETLEMLWRAGAGAEARAPAGPRNAEPPPAANAGRFRLTPRSIRRHNARISFPRPG